MLKQLTQLFGVSGNEAAVREFILSRISPLADQVTVDSMGNVIAFKKGTAGGGQAYMALAHMDEVGLIISGVTEDGFLKLKAVGGIDERILLTQRVRIGARKVPGVIGIKAVHLQSKEARKKIISIKDMYIDIGASSKEDALKSVSLGDYAAFDSDYTEFGDGLIKAKALDDRAGCGVLLSAMDKAYAADIYFCFSVQEETGLRGATVLAHRLKPACCIVFEGTNAADIAFVPEHETVTHLGGGPALSIMDRASYSSKPLNAFIESVAKKSGIPYQYKRTSLGGNDAGAVQTAAGGCETAVLSLPVRYIHSPVSVAQKTDYEAAKKLAAAVLGDIHTYRAQKKERIK